MSLQGSYLTRENICSYGIAIGTGAVTSFHAYGNHETTVIGGFLGGLLGLSSFSLDSNKDLKKYAVLGLLAGTAVGAVTAPLAMGAAVGYGTYQAVNHVMNDVKPAIVNLFRRSQVNDRPLTRRAAKKQAQKEKGALKFRYLK